MKSFVESTKVKNDGTLVRHCEAKEIIPFSFAEMEEAVYRVGCGEGVILDFTEVVSPLAQRMLDFASGAVYALRGTMKKIKKEKYLLLPYGVSARKVRERE